MIYNEWDDILFWEDYNLFYNKMMELNRKYDVKDLTQRESWCKERDVFYLKMIPSKEEFIRRFQVYAHHGKPYWIEGCHTRMNEMTHNELMKSYRFASDENGAHRVEMAEHARKGWASEHLSKYVEKVCSVTKAPHKILEMTVGAGTGTNAVVRALTNEMMHMGVDIDFVCAKNADAIGRYYRKKSLGVCASLWDLPFSGDLFDVVCSHFGLDECREIPTILQEAVRVLKPGGRLVLVLWQNGWRRRYRIFEKYGIEEVEALDLMRQVRLYADFEQLESLAAERGIVRTDYIPFENCYLVEYTKV